MEQGKIVPKYLLTEGNGFGKLRGPGSVAMLLMRANANQQDISPVEGGYLLTYILDRSLQKRRAQRRDIFENFSQAN
ncbi:MAG: hypothetical protein V3U04_05960 [Candidatus Aerophobetes bacterium]